MVLVGKINQQIVGYINRHGHLAAGVTGKDGHLLQVKKHKGGRLGFVGEVEKVNSSILTALESQGFIPIIAPIGLGKDGNAYNCNADSVAGAIAANLKAEKLILLTDQTGIMADLKKAGSLIHSIGLGQIPGYIRRKVIAGGMIPKVQACAQALKGGVGKSHIIDGRVPHALLLEIFTDEGVGTEIVKRPKKRGARTKSAGAGKRKAARDGKK